MNTKIEQYSEEIGKLDKKLSELRELINPLQKRKTYLANRIATLKVRESRKKVK